MSKSLNPKAATCSCPKKTGSLVSFAAASAQPCSSLGRAGRVSAVLAAAFKAAACTSLACVQKLAECEALGEKEGDDQANDADIQWAPYFARLGLNTRENMAALKNMVLSMEADMLVVPFGVIEPFGKIPRSSDGATVRLADLHVSSKVVYISHSWLRPWHTKEECEAALNERAGAWRYHEWAGSAHPDDADASKHALICAGVRRLAKGKGWDVGKVYLWVDYFGIEQDQEEQKAEGFRSRRAYVAVSDAILIPSLDMPPEGAHTIHSILAGQEDRGWTLLEAMARYAIDLLKSEERPEIWVASGAEASYLHRYYYVLEEMPAEEIVLCEGDKEYVLEHQQALMRDIKGCVAERGYVAQHKGWVYSVAFHPSDGSIVASSGGSYQVDGVIKLVKRETGTVMRELVGHEKEVCSIGFNPDGTLIASCGGDGTVRVWDVETGVEQRRWQHQGARNHAPDVLCVDWSKDGRLLATGGVDKAVRLWEAASGELKCSLEGHTGAVLSVAWGGSGGLLASGSHDASVRVWDAASGKLRLTFEGNTGPVCCVAWSPDGMLLVSGGNELRVWDAASGELAHTLVGHTEAVRSAAWSPDGCRLVSGDCDKAVRVWDASSGDLVRTFEGHTGLVWSVSWSPEGGFIVSGGIDGMVRVWEASLGEIPRSFQGHIGYVRSVAWSPDGVLLASGGKDKIVRVWEAASGELRRALKGHTGEVGSVVWGGSGGLLASGDVDGTFRVWVPASGEVNSVWSFASGNLELVSGTGESLNPEVAALVELCRAGERQRVAGSYTVDSDFQSDTVHVYLASLASGWGGRGAPVCSFRLPSIVVNVACRMSPHPPLVAVGCFCGQVVILEAPILLLQGDSSPDEAQEHTAAPSDKAADGQEAAAAPPPARSALPFCQFFRCCPCFGKRSSAPESVAGDVALVVSESDRVSDVRDV